MSINAYLDGCELLVSLAQAQNAVADQAGKLNAYISGELNKANKPEGVVVLSLLNGGIIYTGMLLPLLDFDLELDSLAVSRYRENDFGGNLQWHTVPRVSLKNKMVLLLDDIFDQGITIKKVGEWCREQGAYGVLSCVLAWKDLIESVESKPDYYALTIPDKFVVGLGMDFAGRYRNAPGIYAVLDNNSVN